MVFLLSPLYHGTTLSTPTRTSSAASRAISTAQLSTEIRGCDGEGGSGDEGKFEDERDDPIRHGS
jgi:hypothetical protein